MKIHGIIIFVYRGFVVGYAKQRVNIAHNLFKAVGRFIQLNKPGWRNGRRVRPASTARRAQNRISQGVKIIQMYTVYILRSISKSFQYVGMTNDIERRLQEHNSGYSLVTKKYLPFKLVYTEIFPDRKSARVREKYFKSGSGREYVKSLCL